MKPAGVDAAGLEAELRRSIRGEVRFDAGSRAIYSTDASNYRQVPIGVVVPADRADVLATVGACRRFGAPVLSRGGGTSIAGQCCNVAVVMDFSKRCNRLVELDPERLLARVEPGLVLDHLRDAAEEHGLTFGPDPATHAHCTLGGMIGNNSCGVHSVMAGRTADNVVAATVLTYDGLTLEVGATSEEEIARIVASGGRRGEIYGRLRSLRDRYADLIRARYPKLPRRVSGYNLDELLPENGFQVARALVGTEGTCVTLLDATVQLVSSPPARALVALGYPDVFAAADHVMEVLAAQPIGLEGLDAGIVDDLEQKGLHREGRRLLPEGRGWLLAELGGATPEEARGRANDLLESLRRSPDPPAMRLFTDPAEQRRIWQVRESGLAATAHVAAGRKDNWEGWEDSAVPPARLAAYLRDLSALLKKYDYKTVLYGHFGEGCVHCRMDWDLLTADGIAKWKRFLEEAAELVISYGGSLSGEHGDGQARGWLLPKMFGEELVAAFREFKAIWDPEGRMNPGKVVDPDPVDANLRLGTAYRPAEPATRFRFPADQGSFARAALRCVGAGVCRRQEGGLMCPSYRATRDERETTRGRARLLFEMLRGDPVAGGWRSLEVKEALDLCLACKGCKGECPVNVDMASYKAEFFSHFYEGRLRPREAYAFGLVGRWAPLAARAPRLANAAAHAPGLGGLLKLLVGIHPARHIPALAPQSFRRWFARRARSQGDGPAVLLWADTFNNYFRPQTAIAAVEVLEAAGFRVEVDERPFCCGRPLYDYGMLPTAKSWLSRIVTALAPRLRAGMPVVVLEPSCASVFRDELLNFFPEDEDAQRLARQTFLLSEILERSAPGWQPPRLGKKAIVQGHCHQQAVLRMDDERAVLGRLGLDFEVLDSGCCGMAGAFGFERRHYDVAQQIGERVLLPAVRQAAPETLILADGFSCREQIAQSTGRQALHLAEVLRMAMHEGSA